MSDHDLWEYEYEDDDNDNRCSWCGGEGFSECDDPLQCSDPACSGGACRCTACDGRGFDQRIW